MAIFETAESYVWKVGSQLDLRASRQLNSAISYLHLPLRIARVLLKLFELLSRPNDGLVVQRILLFDASSNSILLMV